MATQFTAEPTPLHRAKPEFILVYVWQGTEYDNSSFASRQAAQAYKEEQVNERGVEIMTRKQWATWLNKCQKPGLTEEEGEALLDRILNR